MFSKSSWLHLRIPFSYFLLPVFLFAFAISPNVSVIRGLIVFICLHIFLYPASNGYNSYFDKDEGSIGGLKNPPKVSKSLYYLSLVFDLIALLLASYNIYFLIGVLIYGLVSKAYSHPIIRIKKYPFGSWFIAGFFQGFFTFIISYVGLNNISFFRLTDPAVLIPASLTSLMLWGSYPMTQIYQHEEDQKRGDFTLSIKLGIMGTFHFVAIMFSFSTALFFLYFQNYFDESLGWKYIISTSPILIFFLWWYHQVRESKQKASYENTMRLNLISSTCLNLFFIYLFFSQF